MGVRGQAVLLHVVDEGVHLQLMVALLEVLQVLAPGAGLLGLHPAFVDWLGGYGGYGNRDGHLARDELVIWGGGGT